MENQNTDSNLNNATGQNVVLGILAHVDAGKTTLSEDLLYHFKMIRSIGRVDDKNTFLDTDSVERERGITIYAKQAVLEGRHGRITLLDTPGHVDFSGEMQRTLSVLDGCLFVVSGADGIDAHTASLWQVLKEHGIPVMLFVNKMDQFGMRKSGVQGEEAGEGKDAADNDVAGNGAADADVAYDAERLAKRKAELLAEMKKYFGEGCIEFTAEDLSGITEGFGESNFFEAAASEEESAMEDFLSEGGLSLERIREMWRERIIFPVVFGSALHRLSIEEIALLADELPDSLNEERVQELLEELSEEEQAGDLLDTLNAAGRIFKITRDAQGNRLTHLKLFTGQLSVRSEFAEHGKINQIRIVSGSRFDAVNEAGAGEIITLTGLNGTYAGEGFVLTSAGKWYLSSESGRAPFEPVLRYRVIPPEGCDIGHELLPKLRILEEEEPLLSVEDNSDRGEVLVSVMGQVQMEILQRAMADRFGLAVTFSEGTILYKETITGVAEGVGHFEPLRHYAEAHLLLEPLPAGSGLVFETDVSTDLLATNWQRLILTHLKERPIRGVLTGSPMTDMRITVVGGKAHPKHTEGGDFRQATYRGIRQGLMQLLARSEVVLLEPYERFEIRVPSDLVGRIMTDFDRLDPPVIDYETGRAVLTGIAPTAKLQTYFRELTAFSRGEGRIDRDYIGYGPCHNPEEVIAAKAYQPENDLRYTADSVFCSSGSGYNVPWNEVYEHMHFPLSPLFLSMISGGKGASGENDPAGANGFATSQPSSEGSFAGGPTQQTGSGNMVGSGTRSSGKSGRGTSSSDGPFLGTDEIDSIISKTFYANSSRDGRDPKRGGSSGGALRKNWGRSGGSGSGSGENGGNAGNGSAGSSGKRGGKSLKEPKRKVLLVDGYNVIFCWQDLKELANINIDSARDALSDRLGSYQAWNPDLELILVFDAYRVKGGAGSEQHFHGIRIVYTQQDETADSFIERFAHDNRDSAVITVVTSDRLEQITIRSQGCYLMGSHEFEREVIESCRRGMEEYEQLRELQERKERQEKKGSDDQAGEKQ